MRRLASAVAFGRGFFFSMRKLGNDWRLIEQTYKPDIVRRIRELAEQTPMTLEECRHRVVSEAFKRDELVTREDER